MALEIPNPFVLSIVEGRATGDSMAFWAYLLRCADGGFYAGHTDALEAGVGQHLAGRGSAFTAKRLPVMLAWSESFGAREEALATERQIKGWSRARKEALIADDWVRIHGLAVSREAAGPSTSLRTNGVGGDKANDPFVRSSVEAPAPIETPAP